MNTDSLLFYADKGSLLASDKREKVVAVNFKSYVQATAESGVLLAKAIEETAKGCNARILLVPQISDLSLMVRETRFEVFAPYCNITAPMPYTGIVTAEMLKKIGCSGFLLNMCDNKTQLETVTALFQKAGENELKIFAYVNSYLDAEFVSAFRPFAIEFACKENSKIAKLELAKAIELFKKVSPTTRFLVGGGISGREHVEEAIKLGADGVAIAGCIINTEDPKKIIREIIMGL